MNFFFRKKTGVENGKNSGFTLIEMIVSTSLFIITILVVVGALISLESASRKARTIRVASDNLSAALDSMSRNIRMGSAYHCGCGTDATDLPNTAGDTTYPDEPRECQSDTDGASGEVCFAFEHQNGDVNDPLDQYVYRLKNSRIQRSTEGGVANSWLDMTAPEITISNLKFFVGGTTIGSEQGYVTIVIRGSAGATAKSLTAFDVQTTLSQRGPNYDFYP